MPISNKCHSRGCNGTGHATNSYEAGGGIRVYYECDGTGSHELVSWWQRSIDGIVVERQNDDGDYFRLDERDRVQTNDPLGEIFDTHLRRLGVKV